MIQQAMTQVERSRLSLDGYQGPKPLAGANTPHGRSQIPGRWSVMGWMLCAYVHCWCL